MNMDDNDLKILEIIKSKAKQLTLAIPQFSTDSDKEKLHKDALDLLINVIELENLLLNKARLEVPKKKSQGRRNRNDHTTDDIKKEKDKILRKIPRWANNLNQINSKILKLYLTLESEKRTPITERMLMEEYGNESEFQRNYSQMKIIAPKNHCKVFDVHNGIIEIWEPAKSIINDYKKYFLT